MGRYELMVNGQPREAVVPDDMPLLWVLRDVLGLTGAKYGCGVGVCGACTVHLDGGPEQSCQVPVSQLAARKVTTIEGLSEAGDHPVQKSWIAGDVPQCGYCQPAQLLLAAALAARTKPGVDRQRLADEMSEAICRCGSYPRIMAALQAVVEGRSDD
jgi:isoquinoline 1-oxidoreductase alpha subunit